MKIQTLLIILSAFFSFFLITGLGWLYYQYQSTLISTTLSTQTDSNHFPSPTLDPLSPYNILIVGFGGGNHEGGKLTDTIMVAHIDPKTQLINLISIPRDLWVPLQINGNEPTYSKINSAYAIGSDDIDYPYKPHIYTGDTGGYLLAKDTVELVTGLPIHHFIAVSFDSFTKVLDSLGNIQVQVDQAFQDPFYPIEGKEDEPCDKSPEDIANLTATMSGYLLEQQFPCRYETLDIPKGLVTMDSQTALKFARSRHSPTAGNDFNRTLRQQAIIKAVKNKLLSLGTLPKLIPLISSLSDGFQTTISPQTLLTIINTHDSFKNFSFHSIALTTDNVLKDARSKDGQYILTPNTTINDWPLLHEFINTQIASASANLDQ